MGWVVVLAHSAKPINQTTPHIESHRIVPCGDEVACLAALLLLLLLVVRVVVVSIGSGLVGWVDNKAGQDTEKSHESLSHAR